MKYLLSLFGLSLLSWHLHAQFTYIEADTSTTVSVNNRVLSAPFSGGYNTAQINEMDLNLDGIMDLVVYDRARGQLRTYINEGIRDSVSYLYSPEYASAFPELRDFLLTRDFNNDGKMDLFDGSSNLAVWENTSTPATGLSFTINTKLKSLYSPNSPFRLDINPGSSDYPGIYDIDGDNDLDLFLFNSNAKTVDYHRNLSQDNNNNYVFEYERRNTCWGNFLENSGSSSILLDTCQGGIPPNGELQGEEPSAKNNLTSKGLKHAGSTLTMLDIDNNGSTDLLLSDVDAYEVKLLLNSDSVAPFVDSRMFAVIDSFPSYDRPIDLLFAATFLVDVNNDGNKDLLAAPNITNLSTNFPLTKDNILYYKNIASNGGYRFQFVQDDFLKDQSIDVGLNSYPIFFDYNKDGLLDLLIGNDGYVNDSLSDYVGQLALFKNNGTANKPSFELMDDNYLSLPSLLLDRVDSTPSRNIFPCSGDIDGDGDLDLLITVETGDIFLFEDTATAGNTAEFKWHNTPYQGLNIPNRFSLRSSFIYDLNKDGAPEVIVSDGGVNVEYFPNFGTASNPIHNIKLKSILWQQANIFRYEFEDTPNFSMLEVGDTMAVNNAINPNNNSFIPLVITAINSSSGYIECDNLLGVPLDASYNEATTTAYINFYNRRWGNFRVHNSLRNIKPFLYSNSSNETQLLVGSSLGINAFFDDIPDTLAPGQAFTMKYPAYLKNYGLNSSIHGADINNDGKLDLIVGNEAGGVKLLFGDQDISSPVFSVSPSSLLIPSDSSSSATFDISANVSWTITENAPWLELSSYQGFNNLTITATVIESNKTASQRSELVVISSPPLSPIRVTITQDTISSVGINETSFLKGLKVFPNPSKGQLNIDFHQLPPGNTSLSLYEASGRLLFQKTLQQKSNQLNLEGLSKGVYILSIKNNQDLSTRRLILQE
jgi:hypothetical protein